MRDIALIRHSAFWEMFFLCFMRLEWVILGGWNKTLPLSRSLEKNITQLGHQDHYLEVSEEHRVTYFQ